MSRRGWLDTDDNVRTWRDLEDYFAWLLENLRPEQFPNPAFSYAMALQMIHEWRDLWRQRGEGSA